MKNRQCGVAALELALVLPLLLAIGFGITEFGRGIYTYNTLAKSARDAARYLSTQAQGDQPTGPPATSTYTVARNLAVYGKPRPHLNDPDPTLNDPPLVPGLATSMVVICDASTQAGGTPSCPPVGSYPVVNIVTVTITGYRFTPVLDLLGFTRFYTGGTNSITSIPFGDISVTMRQQG